MTVQPSVKLYTPPTVPPAEETIFPIGLSDEDRLVVRLRTYRKKIVDYAVMQETFAAGEWCRVARIDCCRGTVHRHLETRSGKVLLDHDPICDIPHGDGAWDVVHDSYEGALDEMLERWDDNLRRWRHER